MVLNTNSVVEHVIKIKSGIMINANTKCFTFKKDYSCNACSCICKNSRYLHKTFFDDSIILYDETMNVTDTVSIILTYAKSANVTSAIPNATNTKPTNVMSTLSTNVTSSVTINRSKQKIGQNKKTDTLAI